MPKFEIREGDGNQGCYRRGTIVASNAFAALRLASRSRMIWKPKDVTINSFDGDNEHAYATSYVAPIWGDCCRWCAEANLIDDEPTIHLAPKGWESIGGY